MTKKVFNITSFLISNKFCSKLVGIQTWRSLVRMMRRRVNTPSSGRILASRLNWASLRMLLTGTASQNFFVLRRKFFLYFFNTHLSAYKRKINTLLCQNKVGWKIDFSGSVHQENEKGAKGRILHYRKQQATAGEISIPGEAHQKGLRGLHGTQTILLLLDRKLASHVPILVFPGHLLHRPR